MGAAAAYHGSNTRTSAQDSDFYGASNPSFDLAISLVLPVYYTSTPFSIDEREAAIAAWNSITKNKCEAFLTLKYANPDLPFENCLDYFVHTFHTRLFDVHPICRIIFQENKILNDLVTAINLIIDEVKNGDTFNQLLSSMAVNHTQLGIKAVQCKLSFR
jgi:hypothetical protein